MTQSMFENGTLICHGEAEAFVNIIRTNRKSIQNMDSNDVFQYLAKHENSHSDAGNNNDRFEKLSTVEEESKVSNPFKQSLSPREKSPQGSPKGRNMLAAAEFLRINAEQEKSHIAASPRTLATIQ